jgi:hypothetical protein
MHSPCLVKAPCLTTDALSCHLGCVSSQVYVILFGVGQKHTSEGIYSLRGLTPEGLPLETIIAFECEEDAER